MQDACPQLLGESLFTHPQGALKFLWEFIVRPLLPARVKAKTAVLDFVDRTRIKKDTLDRSLLVQIAQASLRTKMHKELADLFTDIVVDAVLTIKK